MGTFSIWHWVVVAVVVLLLFGGRGKLSSLMGDAAKGINAFKKGLKEEAKKDKDVGESDQASIEQDTVTASTASEEQDTKTVKG